ncbi:MAG: hypothetical protein JNL43_13415 [Flavobacteriales bacterium]|nr:hypothetical protein [Flavobacteriales bacterium]
MHISGYANMVLKHVSFHELVRIYGEWALGVGEFKSARKRRLDTGTPSTLRAQDVIERVEIIDEERKFQLRTRSMADRWICHWIHADASVEGRSWNNVVEILKLEKDELRLTHVAGWWSSDPEARYYEAAPPNTLKYLLGRYANQIISPKEITRNEPQPLGLGESDHFVKHILLNPKREQPILLITPYNDNGSYAVNYNQVQARVAGACMVVVPEDPEVCLELSRAMRKAGFDPKTCVSNGAARMYFKGLKPQASPYESPLVFIDPRRHLDQRTQFLAAFAISQYGKRLDQNKWVDIVSRFDRQEFRERLQSLLTVGAKPLTVDPGLKLAMEEQLLEKDIKTEELQGKLDALHANYAKQIEGLQEQFAARESELLKGIAEAEDYSQLQEDEIDKLKDEVNQQLIKIAEQEQRLLEAAQAKGVADWDDMDAIDVLLQCKAMFPNLKVHDGAERACAASPFRDGRSLFLVLSIVAVTGGTGALQEQLKRHMGDRAAWKPKDSEQTKKAFKAERQYRSLITGKPGELNQHITIGGSERTDRHIQVYFEAFPDGQVELIYVGAHKNTVSHNT